METVIAIALAPLGAGTAVVVAGRGGRGHAKCGVRQGAQETVNSDGRCPVCGRPMTLGVLHRVATLSEGDTASQGVTEEGASTGGLVSSPSGRPPFMRLVPRE